MDDTRRIIANRLADLLCFARKYESHSDAEILKRISVNYLAAIDKAIIEDNIGKDTVLEQKD